MGLISVSLGNSKLGDIHSVSLPAVATCRECDCKKKCYALRIEKRRKNVAKAYRKNFEVLQSNPDAYWREVEAHIMMSRYFRFHVSGDIPDKPYFLRMISVAERNPHCEILCFTKRFEFVNDYLSSGKVLPPNLHMIFSVWKGFSPYNPFQLPEAHVRYRDKTTTAKAGALECTGNCTSCAQTDGGCWSLKKGEQVVFNEH